MKLKTKTKEVIRPGEELEINFPTKYRKSGEDRMWRYKAHNIYGEGSVFDLESVSNKFLKRGI